MVLKFSKFYFSILLICVLTLSLGSVFAVSNDDVIDVAEIDYSVSDSNFVVDYDDSISGKSVDENKTAFGNTFSDDDSLFVLNQNGTKQKILALF